MTEMDIINQEKENALVWSIKEAKEAVIIDFGEVNTAFSEHVKKWTANGHAVDLWRLVAHLAIEVINGRGATSNLTFDVLFRTIGYEDFTDEDSLMLAVLLAAVEERIREFLEPRARSEDWVVARTRADTTVIFCALNKV